MSPQCQGHIRAAQNVRVAMDQLNGARNELISLIKANES